MDGQSAFTLRLGDSSTKLIVHSDLPFIAKTTWKILRKIPWERIMINQYNNDIQAFNNSFNVRF